MSWWIDLTHNSLTIASDSALEANRVAEQKQSRYESVGSAWNCARNLLAWSYEQPRPRVDRTPNMKAVACIIHPRRFVHLNSVFVWWNAPEIFAREMLRNGVVCWMIGAAAAHDSSIMWMEIIVGRIFRRDHFFCETLFRVRCMEVQFKLLLNTRIGDSFTLFYFCTWNWVYYILMEFTTLWWGLLHF